MPLFCQFWQRLPACFLVAALLPAVASRSGTVFFIPFLKWERLQFSFTFCGSSFPFSVFWVFSLVVLHWVFRNAGILLSVSLISHSLFFLILFFFFCCIFRLVDLHSGLSCHSGIWQIAFLFIWSLI